MTILVSILLLGMGQVDAARCISGPKQPTYYGCSYYDTDRDGDVDMKDWSRWSQSIPLTPPERLEELRKLPKLPKIHYSWPISHVLLTDPLAREYIRITGSWPLWINEPEANVRLASQICNELGGSLCVISMPWTLTWSGPPTATGPAEDTEVAYTMDRLNRIKGWATAPITMVAYDSEVFSVRDGGAEWQAAMDRKYNLFYDGTKAILPGALIEWFCRGETRPGGWTNPFFTLNEKGDFLSWGSYRTAESAYYRGICAATALRANGGDVNVWVALASSWGGNPEYWVFSYPYSTTLSYDLGAFLRTAPVKYVFFWPMPFDYTVPWWTDHFVAYVKGFGAPN